MTRFLYLELISLSFVSSRQRESYCVKSFQLRSFFWSIFSCIRTVYGDLRSKSSYSVRIHENTDQKKLRNWTLFISEWEYSSEFDDMISDSSDNDWLPEKFQKNRLFCSLKGEIELRKSDLTTLVCQTLLLHIYYALYTL